MYDDYCRTKGDRKRHPNRKVFQRELTCNKVPEWFASTFEHSVEEAKTKRIRQHLINQRERRRTRGRKVARQSNKQFSFIQ